MTDRICPRCTCAIVIPVVDSDQRHTGWQCTECPCAWEEFDLKPAIEAVADLPVIDPIRGGLVE